MKVTLNNLHARVTDATDAEWEWLDGYLTFRRDAFRRDKKTGRMAHFVEEDKLLTHQGYFPAGLVSSAVLAGAKQDPPIRVELTNLSVAPAQPDPLADVSWLRDYQREAFDRAVQLARGILWMPTGAGKTEVASALMRAVPVKWLFVAHRTQLAVQAGERFQLRTGEAFGVVAEGRWEPARVTVATFQTLHAALSNPAQRATAVELLRAQHGIIVDECHTASAETFRAVLAQTPNAYWRIGLSGTPLARSDERSVLAVAFLDRPIYRITTDRLVAAGALAAPEIRMVRCLQVCRKPTYQGFYSEAVVGSRPRNALIVQLALREPGPVLVFVRQTKHGTVLRTLLARAGADVRYVDGSAPLDKRLAAVRWLEDRTQRRVLITTTIMQEGVDIPALETVIYASGGESAIAVLQSLGRGSRTDGGRKTTFRFWDVYDEAPRYADDPTARQWGAEHARARARAYASEWGRVLVGPSVDGPFTELATRAPAKGGAR